MKKRLFQLTLTLLSLSLFTIACNLPSSTQMGTPASSGEGESELTTTSVPSLTLFAPPPRSAAHTPTPDAPHAMPETYSTEQIYYVKSGDTLMLIASYFGVSAQTLIEYNGLSNPDILSLNQAILIPPSTPSAPAPAFKLIPDSELVNGPYNAQFDLPQFIAQYGGHLALYREEIDGRIYSGAEIIQLVAEHYSVNPRLLLALLEYQSGWLTRSQPTPQTLAYPMGYADASHTNLYRQLTWAANQLNFGYYAWQSHALSSYLTTDGKIIPANPTLNGGTIGLHFLFAQLYDDANWRIVVSEAGFIQTYQSLYDDPFAWAIEPLLPPDLTQPTLILPFEPGVGWYFTGGPHGGWDGGSAWAALDFAPPSEILGCVQSPEWVTAAADGLILIAEDGFVLQDLDGDGNPGTGWTILYMHVDSKDRVAVGTTLKAGDRIGHPSCEGGISTGTHLHIARKYNGMWISADGPLPFVMNGWQSVRTGTLYDGYLQQGDTTIPACECQDAANTIGR